MHLREVLLGSAGPGGHAEAAASVQAASRLAFLTVLRLVVVVVAAHRSICGKDCQTEGLGREGRREAKLRGVTHLEAGSCVRYGSFRRICTDPAGRNGRSPWLRGSSLMAPARGLAASSDADAARRGSRRRDGRRVARAALSKVTRSSPVNQRRLRWTKARVLTTVSSFSGPLTS